MIKKGSKKTSQLKKGWRTSPVLNSHDTQERHRKAMQAVARDRATGC
jgi:hypothetical protein